MIENGAENAYVQQESLKKSLLKPQDTQAYELCFVNTTM